MLRSRHRPRACKLARERFNEGVRRFTLGLFFEHAGVSVDCLTTFLLILNLV
jgi:hypothetical protein